MFFVYLHRDKVFLKMEKPGRKIVEEYWADGEWHYVYSNKD